jgi:hypothetical protein
MTNYKLSTIKNCTGATGFREATKAQVLRI